MTRIVADAPIVKSASLAAADLIRQAIIQGRLRPGQRLKEEQLSRELGISRTPVREALLILQTEGLLDGAPNRGVTVPQFELDDLEELYGLRALLEGFGARRAAMRISEARLERLRESCERFEALCRSKVVQVDEVIKENWLFHEIILEAADSARLSRMVRAVFEVEIANQRFGFRSPERRRVTEVYHRQLISALTRRDGERAEAVMKEHVLEARDFLQTAIGTTVPETTKDMVASREPVAPS